MSPTRQREADALVVFGISGDLARKMTFRALYRLERRGLLNCPVIGVAVDDWSDDELRAEARESIQASGEQLDEDCFARFAARLSYVSGDFSDDQTYQRVRTALGGPDAPGGCCFAAGGAVAGVQRQVEWWRAYSHFSRPHRSLWQ